MKVQYDPRVIEKLKKVNVRIRNSFKERLRQFEKNPNAPQLNNHALKKKFLGFRSIDITANYRAVYEELRQGKSTIAYFVLLGTHKELYR